MTEVCGDTTAESCVFTAVRNVPAEYHIQLVISYLIEVTSFPQKDSGPGEVRNL